MGLAVIILGIFAICEMFIIYGLLNRLLAQAGVRPLEVKLPSRNQDDSVPAETRKHLFTVDIPS